MLAGFAGQHVVSLEDLNIDIFLEVQNTRYSQILNLIDYVFPGLHFWQKNSISREMCQNLEKSRFTNKYPDGCYESVFRFCNLTGGAAAPPHPSAFNWGGCRPPRHPRISWGPQNPPPANYGGLRPSNSPQQIGKTIVAGV